MSRFVYRYSLVRVVAGLTLRTLHISDDPSTIPCGSSWSTRAPIAAPPPSNYGTCGALGDRMTGRAKQSPHGNGAVEGDVL